MHPDLQRKRAASATPSVLVIDLVNSLATLIVSGAVLAAGVSRGMKAF